MVRETVHRDVRAGQDGGCKWRLLLNTLSSVTYVCILYQYLHVSRCSHITDAYMSNTVWILPNLHLVLYHLPLSPTLDGEVCCYASIMSSHAPGEGGKNSPVQITEGPSIVPAIRHLQFRTKSCRHHRSDLDSCFLWPPLHRRVPRP